MPLRDESKNLPGLLDAWHCRELCVGGPCITCNPSSVEVVFNSCFHDDTSIDILGEDDDGFCRGLADVGHQRMQQILGLVIVLGKVTRQDDGEFNADVLHLTEYVHKAVSAILPVLIITSYNDHCLPFKLPHQLSNGLCLIFITRYRSQKSGELQLFAEQLAS